MQKKRKTTGHHRFILFLGRENFPCDYKHMRPLKRDPDTMQDVMTNVLGVDLAYIAELERVYTLRKALGRREKRVGAKVAELRMCVDSPSEDDDE